MRVDSSPFAMRFVASFASRNGFVRRRLSVTATSAARSNAAIDDRMNQPAAGLNDDVGRRVRTMAKSPREVLAGAAAKTATAPTRYHGTSRTPVEQNVL